MEGASIFLQLEEVLSRVSVFHSGNSGDTMQTGGSDTPATVANNPLLPWPINFNCLRGKRLKQNMTYKGKLMYRVGICKWISIILILQNPIHTLSTLATLHILSLYLVWTAENPIHPTKSSSNKNCLLCPLLIPQAELTALLLCSNSMSCLRCTCY